MSYTKTKKNNIIPIGIRYMVLSALGFALMGTCVKQVSQYGIPLFEIVASRAFISLVISYIDIKRKKISLWGSHKPLLIARGTIGALALICVYYALTTLPLATATILQYLHPLFTALIALMFLKEHIQTSTLLCITLSILGLILIMNPNWVTDSPAKLPPLSLTCAVLGAIGSAIAYVLVRRLSPHEDSSVIIFYFPLITLPLSIILLGDNFVIPNKEACLLLILVGIFTQIGQVGLTKAMQTETASKATAYSYIQIVFALILGWLFFQEIPSPPTLIGGLLIILGSLTNTFKRKTTKTHKH